MYYLGFSYVEGYNLAIWQRTWFVDRLNREIKAYQEKNNGDSPPTRAAHHNTPQMREMMGRHRNMVPSKLRRFT